MTDETLKLSLPSKVVEFEATAVEPEFGTGIGGIWAEFGGSIKQGL